MQVGCENLISVGARSPQEQGQLCPDVREGPEPPSFLFVTCGLDTDQAHRGPQIPAAPPSSCAWGQGPVTEAGKQVGRHLQSSVLRPFEPVVPCP